MSKKLLVLSLSLCLILGIGNVYACKGGKCKTDSNVQDSNDGNAGYIFIKDCEKGNVSVGKWVDPQSITGIKGDTGEQGIRGKKGKKGNTGETGEEGTDGEEGYTPIKGIDYFDGKNGKNGKDVDPKEVKRLNSRIDNVDNRLSELEETQTIVGLEGRIYDSRKWQINVFADYSTNRNKVDRTGVRFTYKFGKSYEEKKIEELEMKLNKAVKELRE